MPSRDCSIHSDSLFSDETMMILAGFALLLAVIAILLYVYNCALWCHDRRRIDPDSPGVHDRDAAISLAVDLYAAFSLGLDRHILDSIPILVCDRASGECTVCLSDIEEGQELRVLPQCKHEFHVLCIDTWFSKQVTCPLCRAVPEMPESPGAPPVVQMADSPESLPTPSTPAVALASNVARGISIVLLMWKLIMDVRAQSGQGSEAEPDLERGEGEETSRPPLPQPSSS